MNGRTIILISSLLLLSSCGQSDNQPAPKLYKDQRDVLDKAKVALQVHSRQAFVLSKFIECERRNVGYRWQIHV